MKLQNVTIIIIIAILAVFLIIVSLFFSTILMASYTDLEEKYVQKDLDQAVNKVNDELVILGNTASDWGPWDDTVHFVQGNNPDYITSNLLPSTFENLNLNIMVFTNSDGDVIYARAYDLQKKEFDSLPDIFQDRLDLKNPLMNMSDPSQVTKGILILSKDPLLVVSQPIVNSDYSGQPQGVVIMGRYLNAEEISRLGSLTRPGLSFIRLDDPSLPPDLVSRIRENTSLPGLIQAVNDDLIAGYALIHDIYGDDVLILQITGTRDISHQGMNTIIQVILIILVGGLLLGFGVIMLINRVVLNRMNLLAQQVQTIGLFGTPADHVEIAGNDELSDLADEINQMLQTIEQTQKRLLDSEEQFRNLVENLPDYIVVYGPEKNVLYINPAAAKAIGYDSTAMIGKPVLSFIPDESYARMVTGKGPLDSEEIPVYEIEIFTKDGGTVPVIVKGTKIQYKSNPATLLVLIDITQRKEIEREREEHSQELTRYSSELFKAARQLSLLTSITRHDILNKISSIYAFIGLVEMKNINPAVSEYINIIKSEINHIQSQIEFTRVYENLGTREPQWIRLDSVMPQSYVPSSVTFIVDLCNVFVYADSLLEKVFFNLLDNSIRHGQHVTAIKVFSQESERGLTVIWEDNGIGIIENKKEQVFERCFGKNTGLGMFLVREILSLTDITIQETGIFGECARFEILVPKGRYRYQPDHDSPDGVPS